MESKLNYTLVGLFVAALLVVGMIAIIWLSGHDNKQQFNHYRVFMTESVSGLSNDSTVKYLGVDVGKVANIKINPDNTQQVEILLKVKQNVSIKTDTIATLKSFGITGLAFIELGGSKNDAPELVSDSDNIPVIQSKPSAFVRIDESLSTIVNNATQVLQQVEKLIDDKNLANFSQLLDESKLLITDLRGTQKHFDQLIAEGIKVGKSAQSSLDSIGVVADQFASDSKAIGQTINKIGIAADSIDGMANSFAANGNAMEQQVADTLKHISSASESVDKLVTSFQHEYSGIGDKASDNIDLSLRAFRQLLIQLDILADDMQRTVNTIEESPSDLLFKSSEPKLGPGEGK